ncbi:MAG: RagB/SusD family nutrient uptake outer membrane protein [Mariniphaga sp.]
MKKLLAIITVLGFFTSCTDFLAEEPRSEMSADQFFSYPSHAYNAVNILYRTGAPSFYSAGVYAGSRVMLGGYMSGYFDNEYKGQEVHVQHAQNLTLNADNLAGYFDGAWDPCYLAISRANFAIANIAETPDLNEAEINQLEAEARFFRAFNYFYLVKTFGDVPLILEPYSSLEGLYVERTPSSQVYDQIIADLEFAVNQGGLEYLPMPENNYRITRATAATLLADVYLNVSGYPVQEDHYADAANAARGVINSGNLSLIEHGADPSQSAYNVLRTSDVSDAYIYVIEYDVSISDNYWQPAITYPNVATSWGIFAYSITNNAYGPVDELLWMFDEENDLRIQEKQFFHSSLTYMDDGEEVTQNFTTAPYLWHNDEALFETGQNGKDMVVYRYAEVLLIAAEAIARSEGVTDEAVGYLADVRSRAYWETPRSEIVAQLSGLSVDEFVREVWKERLREFVLEYEIWSDVQRTRMFPVPAGEDSGEIEFVDVVGHQTVWGATFQEKHLLFPISENEIQRNPNLTQNEGY